MSCDICTEKYNKSNHSKVTCPTCQKSACSECTERYLLMTTENAHCMMCRAAWNREALECSGLSKKFVKTTYKIRREDVLFERERGMMPGTQPMVEKLVVIRRLAREMTELEAEIVKGTVAFHNDTRIPLQVIADEIGSESVLECMMIRMERAYKNYIPYHLLSHEKNMKNALIDQMRASPVDQRREARKFVRACSQNGCNGFLSTAWKCGVCEKRTCPDCHEPKEDEHECKPECIETARLLAKDTKACPKCASLIFKIEGCDQMWCTQCATAFSWRTGQIEVGRIHNPHYYDYQRNVGRVQREIGDIPCGGMPDAAYLRRKYNSFGLYNHQAMNIIMYHGHIQLVVLPYYTPRWTDNEDLRIQYMMNDINEEKFKKLIQQREKDNQKRSEIGNIMNTYQVVTSEIMQRLVVSNTLIEFEIIYDEFKSIREYVNDLSLKVSKRYNCVTPRISEEFSIINLK